MRQLYEEHEDLVLQEAEKTEVEKTLSVAIHGFTKRIDDGVKIISSKFKVGDTNFTVQVNPQDPNDSHHIGVYLNNEEEEDVTATFTFKHASGVEDTLENQELEAGNGLGATNFLSHGAYKDWAKDHGDVFKVDVKITLQVEKGPAQWTSNG